MRVAVIGATGVLGRQVVPRLVERGHTVRAIVRDEAKRTALARRGIEAVAGDILDAASLAPALADCAAAVHLATSVPRAGMPRDFTLNDRIRREGTANLLAACDQAGVTRYVQQSVAHLVAGGGERLLDETAPLNPGQSMSSAADMEAMVRRSGLRWTILRGGAFYGPGTGRDEEWRGLARAGRLVMPGDGSDYLSLIHVADMAEAVVLATLRGLSDALFAIVDDAPVTYRDLFTHLAALEQGPEAASGGPALWPSFRVSNARAREALGWRPFYASYRSGYD